MAMGDRPERIGIQAQLISVQRAISNNDGCTTYSFVQGDCNSMNFA